MKTMSWIARVHCTRCTMILCSLYTLKFALRHMPCDYRMTPYKIPTSAHFDETLSMTNAFIAVNSEQTLLLFLEIYHLSIKHRLGALRFSANGLLLYHLTLFNSDKNKGLSDPFLIIAFYVIDEVCQRFNNKIVN